MRTQLIILGCAALLLALTLVPWRSPVEEAVSSVLGTCIGSAYPPACFDKEIPALLDRGFSMEEAFDVVARVRDATKDDEHTYYFCHVVAHHISAKETAKDSSAWEEVIGRCPIGMCSNGCLHGAAQERFRSDSLSPTELEKALPELRAACPAPSPDGLTMLQYAACFHALGHLGTYVTDAQVPRALSMCDAVTEGLPIHFTRTCYEGVFMQIFQPLDAEDTALVADIAPTNAKEAEAFCAPYAGAALSACTVESWPVPGIETLLEQSFVEQLCTKVPGALWENRCLADVFTILISFLEYDWDRMDAVCRTFAGSAQAHCYADGAAYGLATDYSLIEASVAFCARAEEASVQKRCYDGLLFYAGYSFHEGSDALKTLCRALPDPWGARCTAGEAPGFMKDILELIA